MKNSKSLKFTLFLFLLSIFLLSLRVDYRFIESINCCGDDHTYFVHAETLAEDFDLDYTNQMNFVEGKVISIGKRVVPIGFIGPGILAAPFMFIGNVLDRIFNFLNIENSNIMNYKILIYSLSPVFYFFASIIIFQKIFVLINTKYKTSLMLLIFFGTGLHYYAFERYSMTHVYEVFTISLLIYSLLLFYFEKLEINKIAGIIPYIFLISYLVRYVNYFIFVIPFWLTRLIKKESLNRKLFKNKYFVINSGIAFSIFAYITNTLYGKITLNPIVVYNKQSFPLVEDYFRYSSEKGNVLLDNLIIVYRIFFSQEFGLFWFMPIVSASIVYLILDVYKNFKKKSLPNLLILLSLGLPIGITLVWQSAGSAYGLRYVYGVIPISLFAYFLISKENNYKFLNPYVLIFSLFSFLSVMYFETSATTSLSESEVLNSFGNYVRYSQPEYLTGVMNSLISFNSYFVIFGTSFFGASILKIFSSILGLNEFIDLLSQVGVNIDNADVVRIFNNIDMINGHKFIFIIFFLSLFSLYFTKQIFKDYKK